MDNIRKLLEELNYFEEIFGFGNKSGVPKDILRFLKNNGYMPGYVDAKQLKQDIDDLYKHFIKYG